MRDASEEAKVIQNVMPALRITDYAGSMAFHLYGLGFRVVWEHRVDPYPLVFAQITRAGPTFYLAELFRDCQVGGLFHFSLRTSTSGMGNCSARGSRFRSLRARSSRGCATCPWGTPWQPDPHLHAAYHPRTDRLSCDTKDGGVCPVQVCDDYSYGDTGSTNTTSPTSSAAPTTTSSP